MTERMVRARKSKLSMTISHDNEDEDEHKDELLDNATMIVIECFMNMETHPRLLSTPESFDARHHRGLDHLNYCIVVGQWMHSGAAAAAHPVAICCGLPFEAILSSISGAFKNDHFGAEEVRSSRDHFSALGWRANSGAKS
ncbi:hypothetical protein E4U26_001581 [Claviceps purpurea]|nr:hypothetical protein E4U26_001581 [Claviceps purpurea]